MRLGLILLFVAALLIAPINFSSPAVGAGVTFVVDYFPDGVDASPGDGACATAEGACTLRAAIQETNALPGADFVLVAVQDYTLELAGINEDVAATGDLDITDDLTLLSLLPGGRPGTGIDAAGIDRVFHIIAPAVATISGMRIQNGIAPPAPPNGEANGGGVLVDEGSTLTLEASLVEQNSAAQGGGVYNAGLIAVSNSEISSNTGGGLWNAVFVNLPLGGPAAPQGLPPPEADAVLDRVVVSSNVGGGIANFGGDVVPGFHSTMEVTNSTISANSSAFLAGGITNAGVLTLVNVTIADNSAATYASIDSGPFANTSIRNSIVASNSGPNCEPFPTLFSLGHNVSSDGSCNFTQSGDIQNSDPLLGPLADNGGFTKTHALLAGSPAIDAGTNIGCPATDQRGSDFPRPRDGNGSGFLVCDIGAYELRLPYPATPAPSTPTATPTTSPAVLPPSGGTDARDTSSPAGPVALSAAFISCLAFVMLAVARRGRRAA